MIFQDNLNIKPSARIITPEGYLKAPVVISALGVFDYIASELGEEGTDIKRVKRFESALFNEETLKSFENAPITLGHPDEEVNAHNWKKVAIGNIRNVKREGDQLTAQAYINDSDAIEYITSNDIKELSCGYRADIKATQGKSWDYEIKTPIIGNHVAIVRAGRCGQGVKIADEEKTSQNEHFKQTEQPKDGQPMKDNETKEETKQEGTPVEDQQPTQVTQVNDSNKELIELIAKVKHLTEQNEALTKANQEESQRKAAIADAASVFNTINFNDAATAQDVHKRAIQSFKGLEDHNLDDHTPEQLSALYTAVKTLQASQLSEAASAQIINQQVAQSLLNDAKPKHMGATLDIYIKE